MSGPIRESKYVVTGKELFSEECNFGDHYECTDFNCECGCHDLDFPYRT